MGCGASLITLTFNERDAGPEFNATIMLFLVFQLGPDRYALEASRVVEVVPLLELKRLPHAPKGVAGIFNYHGHPIPAVDLAELTLGRSAQESLSTRIIIVKQQDQHGCDQLLGLIAENATDILRKNEAELRAAAPPVRSAPHFGPAFMDSRGPVQCLREQFLLPEPVRDLLFSEAAKFARS